MAEKMYPGNWIKPGEIIPELHHKIKTFQENLGPWLEYHSYEVHTPEHITVRFTVKDPNGVMPKINWVAGECMVLQRHFSPSVKGVQHLNVVFKYPLRSQENKMSNNEDLEFYYALLQQAGVDVVTVTSILGGDKEYEYLCAIEVEVGDNVVIELRNGFAVGVVKEVTPNTDWDSADFPEGGLKWIVSKADLTNIVTYAEQKNQIMKKLKASRMQKRARELAGRDDLDFDSLVNQTKLALEHRTGG